MKVKDIKKLNKGELLEKEATLRRKLVDMRFEHALGKLFNTASLRQVRADLARVLTCLKQL